MTLLDALLGPQCTCGQRVYPKDRATHHRLEHAGDRVTHARLLDGTTLCPDADPDMATPFLDIATCTTCTGRLARIQGRPTDHHEPTHRRRRGAHPCGDTTCREDHQ